MKEQATLINDFASMKAQGTLTGKEHTAGALCITAINNHKYHNMLMKSKHLLTLLLLTVVTLSAWSQNKIIDLSKHPDGITIDAGGDYTIKGTYFGLPTQETSYLSPTKDYAKAVINITAKEPVNIILDNVEIIKYDYTPKDSSPTQDLEFQYFGAFYAREANNVTIRLKGKNNLRSYNHLPAICVPNDGELVIEDGEPEGNTGELKATGGKIGAGIGSSYENNDFKGKIIIKSGIINASGGTQSAGIGTCYNTSGGIIEILGGTVNAEGGSTSPGIGTGGFDKEGTTAKNGTVIIKGGTITAKGGPYGSTGIGVGYDSDDCNITISGGIITASGTKGHSGIGSGKISAKGGIEITGGTIYAVTNDVTQPDIDSGSQGKLVIDGNPVIVTKEIKHANDPDRKLWNGIVYESVNGKVYQKDKNSTIVIENDVKIDGVGPMKFKRILTIPKNDDETIPTVKINNGVTFTNYGDIKNEGIFLVSGTLISTKQPENPENPEKPEFIPEITNDGKIEVTDNGDIQNEGKIANNGIIEIANNGKIEVTNKGEIQNEGTIANNGEVTNKGKIEVTNKGKIEVTDKGDIQNEGKIANNGEVINDGKIEVADKGEIHNEGTIANNGEVTNNGKIEVTDKGDIQNEGTIANNGEVTNNGKIELTNNGEIQNSGAINGNNNIGGTGNISQAVTYINYDPDKDPKDHVKYVNQNDPIPLGSPKSKYAVFLGWYDKPENGKEVSTETFVKEPTTIYAYWEENKITTVGRPSTLYGTSGRELTPGYDLSALLADDSYTTDITYDWADPDAEHYGLEIQIDFYGKYWLRGIPNKSTDSGDQIAIRISSPNSKLATVINIPVSIMPEPVCYTVTIPKVEGVRTVPSAGTYSYEEGSYVFLTLILNPDYDLSTPVVKANDDTIKRNSNGRYFVVVYNDISFSIDSVIPNISVGIDKPVSTKNRIYATNGMIHIDITTPQDVSVVTFDGRLIRRVSLPAGNNCLQGLPSGFYIVKLSDGTTVKIRNK